MILRLEVVTFYSYIVILNLFIILTRITDKGIVPPPYIKDSIFLKIKEDLEQNNVTQDSMLI